MAIARDSYSWNNILANVSDISRALYYQCVLHRYPRLAPSLQASRRAHVCRVSRLAEFRDPCHQARSSQESTQGNLAAPRRSRMQTRRVGRRPAAAFSQSL